MCVRVGNMVMVTGGHNLGRVGVIINRERHPGSFDIVHIKDSLGHTFATRSVLSRCVFPYGLFAAQQKLTLFSLSSP